MELGFDTIGNATLIAYDRGPVLATDPWLSGTAYFGSWRLTHSVPDEQLDAVSRCEYIWLSHGHPDHMHMPSLERLRDKTLLIPDHVGGRIRDFLTAEGYRVEVLRDRTWRSLSPRVRICSISDPNQDAILMVDMNGVLVIDANDASTRGWSGTVRKAAARSSPTFLLALSGYGDADMINYFDDAGNRVPPWAAKKMPPGPEIDARMKRLGARFFIPFASHHCYQRADSVWANKYVTAPEDHRLGFESTEREILPAFVRYDCLRDDVATLDPPAPPLHVHEPEEFGDDWSEPLTRDDVEVARSYFAAIHTLDGAVDEIVLRVGGTEHVVHAKKGSGRSVVFEAPRASLTKAMQWTVFDDLLIGNFMRTTLHGAWPGNSLNPVFTAAVAKYADNGLARTPAELRRYFATYRQRAPLAYVGYQLAMRRKSAVQAAARTVRSHVQEGSTPHRIGRAAYRTIKRI